MKGLTSKQAKWLFKRNLKVGKTYMLPSHLEVKDPNTGYTDIATNIPVDSAVYGEIISFIDDYWVEVEMNNSNSMKTIGTVHVSKYDMESRRFEIITMILLSCYIPMALYNLISKLFSKKD